MIILTHSCDLRSLRSSIASCRAFYSAFSSCPAAVTKALVSLEIDDAVLPEAILAVRAASIRRADQPYSELPAALSQLFSPGREALLSHKWSFADGIAAIRLHSIIDHLAATPGSIYPVYSGDQITFAIRNRPQGNELARIKRALYRFEIFCGLFPPPSGRPDLGFREAQASFFSQFAPWENEQLACVHELLWRHVAPGRQLSRSLADALPGPADTMGSF